MSSPSLSSTTPTMVSTTPPLEDSPLMDLPSPTSRVRFDDECELIPDLASPSKMPRIVTKSYSLPLWRRRAATSPQLNVNEQPSSPGTGEGGRHVLKVSMPRLMSRAASSRSPTRSEAVHQPLVPCIVNHDLERPRVARRSSVSTSPKVDVVTVPLRPCCETCYHTTEQSLQEGPAWQEKFTRGARRRRNSSAEAQIHANCVARSRVVDSTPGFDAIINVDEVDQRRRSRDFSGSPPSVAAADPVDGDSDSATEVLPSLSRRGDKQRSEIIYGADVIPGPSIEEEDESQNVFIFQAHTASNASSIRDPHAPTTWELPAASSTPELLVQGSTLRESVDSFSHVRSRSSDSRPIRISPASSLSLGSKASPSLSPLAITDSPSSSPDLRRSPAMGSPSVSSSPGRKRAQINIPGPASFLRASAGALKGMTTFGSPLAV